MRNKILSFSIMCFLLISVLFLITGCGKKKEENQNQENKVNQYESSQKEEFELTEEYTLAEAVNEHFKDEERLNGKTIKNYFNPQTFQVLESQYKGIISILVHDFDNDNEEECMVVRTKDNNGVEVVMYKEKDGKINEVSSCLIMDDVLKNGEVMNFDMFAKEIDGEVRIFAEAAQVNSLFSDGIQWTFVQLKVEDDELIEVTRKRTAGSVFQEDEIEEYMEIIKQAGLQVNSIALQSLGKKVVDQDEDVIKICSVERKQVDNFDISKYMGTNVATETKEIYAETMFKDYVVDYELVS